MLCQLENIINRYSLDIKKILKNTLQHLGAAEKVIVNLDKLPEHFTIL